MATQPGLAMAGAPDPWTASPLPAPLAEQARALVARLDRAQRFWLSGYLAAASNLDELADAAAGAPPPRPSLPPVTVLFGSQSGNAERVARETADFLGRRGVACTVRDMMDCGKAELAAAHTLLVVVSTQGEGDPPDRALPLWELLESRRAPSLSHARFAVLALGDSSYRRFCETGRRFDARLEALGATRLRPRVDCDVDFDSAATGWMEGLADELSNDDAGAVSIVRAGSAPVATVSSAHTRRNPFRARVLLNQRLTATGSSKDVRHVELSLEGSGIRYEPGDAIGVVPRNADADVEELLAVLPFDPDTPIRLESHDLPLREVLQGRVSIDVVDDEFLRVWLPDGFESLRGLRLVDVIRDAPPRDPDAAALIALLRPLAPRLYSIASSPHATPDEAHLTIGVVEYEYRGRPRGGLVSGAVAGLTGEGEHLPVYLHRNAGFRLPPPDVPILMIGPGTGIAPFRGFVAERAATGARGRNWLVFGDRRFETDFLYQSEWLAWRRQGVLTRIDVAFSRDQHEKIYVQHRLREHGAEIWRWLQEGAVVYVCGDAKAMAPDVHAALLDVARAHGNLDPERAAEWLTQLQRERRYQRDVY